MRTGRSSYATVLNNNPGQGLENVQADMHFTWYFEVKPAPGGSDEGEKIITAHDRILIVLRLRVNIPVHFFLI